MAKQFQSLQHMRTGPLGGVEALNDDEDRLKQHNEQLFKTLTDDEIQMERLELQETVRKLKEQRKFLSSTKSRPAWGSGNVTDASLRRSTGRPRSSQGRKSHRQTAAPQSHVPQAGIELHNTLGATRTSQPAATMSRADRDHIRALEDKIAALSATVTELRTSQHLTKVAPVPAEEAIPADYRDKVEALAQQHRENVATLRKVYEEKKASDKKIKVLERKLAKKEEPAPEPEPAASKPKRKVKKKKKPKFTAAAVADSPPARNPAISKKGRARVEATPTGDSPAGFTAEREEGKLTDSKGSDGEGDDDDDDEHESGKAGADVDVDVEYDMDGDAGSEGGDFALPTDFDDEDEGGDFSKPGGDDDALGESLLHGVGVAGAPLSSATAAVVKPRSRAKAARAKASKWALAATYGTEPADDVEFVQATRERYLDGAGGGSSSKLSEDGDSQSSGGRRPKSARSKGSNSAKTVPRPFFGMVSREDLHGTKLGISARKRKEEEEERKKQEAALLKWSFTARKPPKSSTEARYARIMKENAARREMNVKARREELESSTAPFKGVLERQQAAAEKWEATKAKILEERKAKEGETRTVKANPIPKWLRKGSLKAQMEAEEKLRKERIARHAAKSRAASKLPKRMAKYAEEKAKAEAEAKRKGKKKGKRRKSKTGVPKVNTKVPDFETMQNDWKRKLESAKKQKKRKPVVPFSFDSEERLKAEAARRKKFQDKMEAEEASKHTPWSETFKKNRAAAVTARHAEPVNSKMTRAAEMRAQKTKELLQKRAQEAMEKRLAEQERKARVKSATKSLSSVVKAMENKRRGGRKLAWEKSSEKLLKEKMRTARENSDAKTAVSAASSRRRKRAEDKRLANRPLLFTRSSIEADSDKAYARALLRVEKNAKPAAEPESKGNDDDGDDFDEDADFLN